MQSHQGLIAVKMILSKFSDNKQCCQKQQINGKGKTMKTMWLVIISCAFISAFSANVFAQDMPKDIKQKAMKKVESAKKSAKEENAKVEDIVRKGTIDLSGIDKNKDGKVFQDPMDWYVISDAAGKCPLCKMKLKEVSLADAKKNLVKFGFKVK